MHLLQLHLSRVMVQKQKESQINHRVVLAEKYLMTIEIAPAVAPPITELIITRNGSAATNGNAPSEIKHKPKTKEALPASRWLLVNLLRAIQVAIAIPIGGTIPAAMAAAIGVWTWEANIPTENV